LITCGRGSALCVTVSGNGHFQHLAGQKSLNGSKQKLYNRFRRGDHQLGQSFIIIGHGVAAPIWVKLSTGGFIFAVTSRASIQLAPSARVPHIFHINRCGYRQRCACWGLIDTSHPMGSYPLKIPHFGDSNGDFQLKRLRAYLGTEETYHEA
jgi:hypothetical protein